MHFHRDVMAICDCFPRSCLQPAPDDIFCGTPPLAFTFGLGGLLLFPMRFGASTVLLEKLTPTALLSAIEQYRADHLLHGADLLPAMAPVAFDYDISQPEEVRLGGRGAAAADAAAVGAGDRHRDHRRHRRDRDAAHLHLRTRASTMRPGATGKPIPGYRACMLDEAGNALPPGRSGGSR